MPRAIALVPETEVPETDSECEQAYSFGMTERFKRVLEAAFWFVVGFVAHMLLVHFHHHP
jgi:hypothetical protein